MKLGIALSTFPTAFGPIVFSGSDLAGNVAAAASLGYDGLDLFIDNKSDAEIDAIGQLLRDNRIEVAMFIAIFLAESGTNLSDSDASKRSRSVRDFKRQIDVAARLSARTMPIGFLRGRSAEGDSVAAYNERLAASLSDLVDYAGAKGITLCLEPINRYEVSTIFRVDEAVELIERYRIEGLKILPDLFYMNIEEVSLENALRTGGSLIGHVHIADSNRLAPGQGHLDYRSLFGVLREVKYDGYLSIEALPKPTGLTCAELGAAFIRSLETADPAGKSL